MIEQKAMESKNVQTGRSARRNCQEPPLRRTAPTGNSPGFGGPAQATALLDEPAAGMNPQETHELEVEMIRWIRDELKLTILLIEHDMSLAGCVRTNLRADYGSIIADGTLRKSGIIPV